MKLKLIGFISIFFFGTVSAQVADTLVPSALIIPAKYSKIFDSAQTVYLPKGFQCSVFYAQSAPWWPRMVVIDPSNRLCVADMGNSQVLALPDNDHDGAADTAIRIAYNDGGANSLAFYHGSLYTAASTYVLKYEHPNAEGLYIDSSVFISNIPNIPEGVDNHFTRTIVFDSVGKNIFLSVGSPCNACKEKDTGRGSILRFNLDGSARTVYAGGLRNVVGLTIDASTNHLWAAVAERNNLGDNTPPEFATHIEENGFYGWPLAYADHNWDDFQADSEYRAMLPITHSDSLLVNSMKVPDILLDAHSTPLSLAFYYGKKLPAEYNGNIFITLHGSYPSVDGRKIADGSKIMRVQKINDQWVTSDFATGFLTDSIRYLRWARPCGVIIDTSGDLYFSSDHTAPHTAPAIFKISYVGINSVASQDVTQPQLRIYPNPTTGIISVQNAPTKDLNITVENLLGETVMELKNPHSPDFTLDLSKLIPGTYYIRFSSANSVVTKMVVRE